MIKAIMVTQYPIDPIKIKGGVEAVSVNLANGFIPVSGVELKIFAANRNIKTDQTEKLAGNISIHYIPYGNIKSTKYAFFFYIRKRLKEFINDYNPDVIHIQGNGSNLLLTYGINKDKIIITQHAILKEELRNQSSLVSRLSLLINMGIEFLMMPKIKNYIFISDYNRKLLTQEINTKKQVALVYNPVNPAFFNIEDNRELINRLIYVGGITQRKGLLDLLKALKTLISGKVHYHLDVVGGVVEAAYSQKIEEFVNDNQLADYVTFHGWLSQKDILKLYQGVQILVLPSYQETLPVCISEAMAAGRVVIAANVGGVAEMIEDNESGFLYEKGNVPSLIHILLNLYLNMDRYQSVSKKARRTALQKYEPIRIAKQTLDFYQKVNINTNSCST